MSFKQRQRLNEFLLRCQRTARSDSVQKTQCLARVSALHEA